MIACQKLNGYLSPFSQLFTKPQWGNFKTILTGFFSEGKKSLSSIAKKVIGSKDQSNLNRFISTSDWNEKEVNDLRLKILSNNKKLKISSKGHFVIDDSLIEEFGKQMEGVGKHFDHTDNQYKNGRTILALFYVEEETVYAIDIRPYYKIEEVGELDFKTKNELAFEMIMEHLPKNERDYPVCLFDSWFSGKDFLEKLDKQNIKFVTRMKSNRNTFYENKKYKLPDLFTHTDIVVAEIEGWDKSLTMVKGEYRENSQDKTVNFYLLSNIDKTTTKAIRDHYDFRWPIEPGFKDLKQLLGWTDLSFKSSLSTLRMIYLSLLAHTIATKEKLKNKVKDTIGKVCDYFRKKSLKEIIKKAYTLGKKKVSLEYTLKAFCV